METPKHRQNLGAAPGLQNTSTSNVRPAAPGAGHCSCTWRRQGACDFIPFGAEPGIEPNTPSCYKQLFDIFNELSLGTQQLWRAECHRMVLSIPAKWCLVTPGSLSPSSSSSLLRFAHEDNQGPLPCISSPSYHTPSVCKALYPVSCFSQGWSSVPPLHLSPWPSAQLPPRCFAGDKGVQAWRQLRAKPGEALRSHALALALPKHLEAFQH